MERTLVIIKPDAVKRKLVGEIISRIEKKNFAIIKIREMIVSKELAEIHYAHLRELPIFNSIIEYFASGLVFVLVIEGESAVQAIRNMIGKTNPFESLPGTIRGDYGSHRSQNLIHASDSLENAEIEIERFFG